MAEPTTDDVDALVGPATPQFAFQIRARVRELVAGLPEDDPVRLYGEEKVELLERLGFASSKAENSEPESRDRIGWETIPSTAPASEPLSRGDHRAPSAPRSSPVGRAGSDAGEPLVPPRAPSSRDATPPHVIWPPGRQSRPPAAP